MKLKQQETRVYLLRRTEGGGGGDRRCFSCSPCIAEVPSRGEPTQQSQDNQKKRGFLIYKKKETCTTRNDACFCLRT